MFGSRHRIKPILIGFDANSAAGVGFYYVS